MKKTMDKIKQICTYHSDDGTSGYLLSDEQFSEIERVIWGVERERCKHFDIENCNEHLEKAAEESNKEQKRFMNKKKRIQLDELASKKWHILEELNKSKNDVLKRRLFKNYPMREKIEFIREVGIKRADFWNHVRFLVPEKKGKTIEYFPTTNEIEYEI